MYLPRHSLPISRLSDCNDRASRQVIDLVGYAAQQETLDVAETTAAKNNHIEFFFSGATNYLLGRVTAPCNRLYVATTHIGHHFFRRFHQSTGGSVQILLACLDSYRGRTQGDGVAAR